MNNYLWSKIFILMLLSYEFFKEKDINSLIQEGNLPFGSASLTKGHEVGRSILGTSTILIGIMF